MKISKKQLRQIIREEYTRMKVRRMLNEKADGAAIKPLLAKDIVQGNGAKDGKDGTYAYNNGYFGIRKGGGMYYIDVQGNRTEIEKKLQAAGFKPGKITLSPKKK